jgi:hypothetical protein
MSDEGERERLSEREWREEEENGHKYSSVCV